MTCRLATGTYYRILYRLCVNRAKAIFTVSEFSRNRLEILFHNASGRMSIAYNNSVGHSSHAARLGTQNTSNMNEVQTLKTIWFPDGWRDKAHGKLEGHH
jgi:hypothetical protein